MTNLLPLQPITTRRHHDRFVRAAGAWRFQARHMLLDQFGNLGQTLLMDVGALER